MNVHAGGESPRLKGLRIFFRTMMLVSALGMAVFGALFIRSVREYSKGDRVYEETRLALYDGGAGPQVSDGASGAAAPQAPSKMDFTPLQAINGDVVGWILAEGSAIDYPIVLGEDNEYYLTHLVNGERNKLGAIFMDFRNHGDFSDRNTAVYGHNMKDGSMFAALTNYKDQNYYDNFPTMALYTPDGDFTLELFAGIVAGESDAFIRFTFTDDADFLAYIDSLKAQSTFLNAVEVAPGDRIVTLCTCSYEFNHARYALFGKLTPVAAQ